MGIINLTFQTRKPKLSKFKWLAHGQRASKLEAWDWDPSVLIQRLTSSHYYISVLMAFRPNGWNH